jgi:dienelactone hydrolase
MRIDRASPTALRLAAALLVVLSAPVAARSSQKVAFPPAGPAFTPGTTLPSSIPGTLSIPKEAKERIPAVVIAHASAGLLPGGVETDYVTALNAAGIATLVIDMWTPRGIPTGPAAYGGGGKPDRRPRVSADTLPDLFGALKFLAEHTAIDPKRIGVMGFSWGAVLSFISISEPLSTRQIGPGPRFVAHAPQYMGCFGLLPGAPGERTMKEPWTNANLLLQIGGKDDLDGADGGANCRKVVELLPSEKRQRFELIVYPNATHSWNAKLPGPTSYFERFANSGKGGRVRIVPDAKVAAQSRDATVAFFRKTFGL